MTKNAPKPDHITDIPDYHIESLARCLLPEIQKFFDSDEGKREFEEWKAGQKVGKQTV
ncbi:MAG: hypothetical protein FWD48_10980 [Oscillospiraceae bacterium]|nr:hypothetical protein [Oscillospiraceae bacterium]